MSCAIVWYLGAWTTPADSLLDTRFDTEFYAYTGLTGNYTDALV